MKRVIGILLFCGQLACNGDMGKLTAENSLSSRSTSIGQQTPPPQTFPAFVTQVTTNTKGASAVLSGPVQALRYSTDNGVNWINLMGPYATSYTLTNNWPLTVNQACFQAQGSDGNWYGATVTETKICVVVKPQWMNLSGLLTYQRFDGASYLGPQFYTDSLGTNQGQQLVTYDALNKAVVDTNVKSINFDGVNDSYVIPYHQKFDVTNLSVSFFIKKTTTKFVNWGHIVGRQLGSSFLDSWIVGYDPRSTVDKIAYNRSNLNEASCSLSGPDNNDYYNQWTHIAVTDDQSTIKLYINGALFASAACSLPFQYDGSQICLGSGANDSNRACTIESVGARISELSIWNRILSAAEISNINTRKTFILE